MPIEPRSGITGRVSADLRIKGRAARMASDCGVECASKKPPDFMTGLEAREETMVTTVLSLICGTLVWTEEPNRAVVLWQFRCRKRCTSKKRRPTGRDGPLRRRISPLV